jgi:hypothetical protein
MTFAARLGVSALLCLATLGARVAVSTPPPAAADLPAAVILQRYGDAMAKLEHPTSMIFEYSLEQSGTRDLEQTHRVYRDANRERDETISIDGLRLKTPTVRVAQSVNRYDVTRLAPKSSDYTFVFAGRRQLDGRAVYAFRTDRNAGASFAVSNVWIDSRDFLPAMIGFHAAAGTLKGSGRIAFGPEGTYWLAREAAVSAKMPNGKVARERIVWSKYRFPASLPASTFTAPHAPVPEVAPEIP